MSARLPSFLAVVAGLMFVSIALPPAQSGLANPIPDSETLAALRGTQDPVAALQLVLDSHVLRSYVDPSESPNLRVTQQLLRTIHREEGPVAVAAALAEIATLHEAALVGAGALSVPQPSINDSPGPMAGKLLRAYGVDEPVGLAAALDNEAPDVRAALAGILAAQLHMDQAARDVFGSGSAFDGLRAGGSLPAGESSRVAELFSARLSLLEAVKDLSSALTEAPANSGTTIDACPALAIDLDGVASVYDQDCALIIDVGGDDTYLNNAGGGHAIFCLDESNADQPPAAALIDLGGGRDVYGDANAPRHCGANGGGASGAGFLFDDGGVDAYTAGTTGTNGGGFLGVGLLVDAGGDDVYLAEGAPFGGCPPGSCGVNGGANLGAGLLVDVDGSDSYQGGESGVNGGASLGGVAMLIDAGSDGDAYLGARRGVNGGAEGGRGFLLDEGGDDDFDVNASAEVDLCFVAAVMTGSCAVNGGGSTSGVGFLFDGAGSDAYTTGPLAANGGAIGGGLGLLVDLLGDDTYTAGGVGVNGGGSDAGRGALLDLAGNDVYSAGSTGTNGGCARLGAGGLLFDLQGSDQYSAGTQGTNGGAASPGVCLLLDSGGTDTYADLNIPSGSGIDRTVLPKGTLGAQVDLPLL